MRFIGRVFVVFFAFLIACLAAGLTFALGLFGTEWQLMQSDPVARGTFWIATAIGTSFTGAKAFLPLLLVVILAEAFKFRSIIFYALAGVGIALVAWYGLGFVNPYEESIDQPGPISHGLQQVIAAGVVFGLTYWVLAGRKAGKWLEPYPTR